MFAFLGRLDQPPQTLKIRASWQSLMVVTFDLNLLVDVCCHPKRKKTPCTYRPFSVLCSLLCRRGKRQGHKCLLAHKPRFLSKHACRCVQGSFDCQQSPPSLPYSQYHPRVPESQFLTSCPSSRHLHIFVVPSPPATRM